jgi:hypothetical protein
MSSISRPTVSTRERRSEADNTAPVRGLIAAATAAK